MGTIFLHPLKLNLIFLCLWRAGIMVMTKHQTVISILELRSLLASLLDHRLNICIRFRLVGEMWQPHHMRVLRLTEKGVLLNDEVKNTLVSIPDLAQIMQFEIDVQFQVYQPHYHYEVSPFS